MANSRYLYHASAENNLTVIKPQRTISKDKYIGDYVFATMDKRFAAMYLAPREAGAILMEVSGDPYIVIDCSPDRFRELDKGGAIYEVSSENFIQTPQIELSDTEQVCKEAVVPISKEVFTSALEALSKYGIKVYFLNHENFIEIQNAKSEGRNLLRKFQVYRHS